MLICPSVFSHLQRLMDASAWVQIKNYELHNNIVFADVNYYNIPKSKLLQLFWDLQ